MMKKLLLFLILIINGCSNSHISDWRYGSGVCEVHKVKMKSVVINSRAGGHITYIDGYLMARSKEFPNYWEEIPPEWSSGEESIVYVCPKCEQAEKDWVTTWRQLHLEQ